MKNFMLIAFLSAGLQLFGQDTILIKKKVFGITYSSKRYDNILLNSDWLIKNVGKKSNIAVHELYAGKPNGLVFKHVRKKSKIYYKFNDTFQLFRKEYFKSKELHSIYFHNGVYNGIVIGHYYDDQKYYWENLRSDFSHRGYFKNGVLTGLNVTHNITHKVFRSVVNNSNYYYSVQNFKENSKASYYSIECWLSRSPDSSLQYSKVSLLRIYELDSLMSIYGIDTNLIIKYFEIQDTMFARLRRKVESEIIGKYGKPIISHLEVEKYLNWRFGIKKSEND